MLSREPIETHASGGEDVAFRPVLPQPVFSHHPQTGELTMIRWNPNDRLPLSSRSTGHVKLLYHAFREWENIIKSEEMELWTQMKIGQALSSVTSLFITHVLLFTNHA
jgi:trimethyllysine dioxygenase